MSWSRLAAAIVFVLHLLVVGGTALAHARHGMGEGGVAHVESEDRDPCPEHRSHPDCPQCRLQNDRPAPLPPAAHPAFAQFRSSERGTPARAVRGRSSARTPLLPRAPPRA